MQIRGIDPTFLYYFNIFLKKTFVVSKILFTFAPEMPTHVRVGTPNKHRWNETLGHLYGQSFMIYYIYNKVWRVRQPLQLNANRFLIISILFIN